MKYPFFRVLKPSASIPNLNENPAMNEPLLLVEEVIDVIPPLEEEPPKEVNEVVEDNDPLITVVAKERVESIAFQSLCESGNSPPLGGMSPSLEPPKEKVYKVKIKSK